MYIDYQIFIKFTGTQYPKQRYHHWWLTGFLFLFFGLLTCIAQNASSEINLGRKAIFNFAKSEYKAATQSWDIAEDKRGMLYFANNDGLLEYNGRDWQLYKVDNQTIVRSVAIDDQGRIFTGAQNELGWFDSDENGQLQYHSLKKYMPASLSLEDVWDIVITGGKVFFRTNRYVLSFDGKHKMDVIYEGSTLFLGQAGGKLYLQKQDFGIIQWQNNTWSPIEASTIFSSIVTAVIDVARDTILFSTLKSGLFHLKGSSLQPWPTPFDRLLKTKRIYHAALCKDGKLALASSLDGLIILDKKGRWWQQYHKDNGLLHNNILCVFSSSEGNLWLGLDNGISAIQLASPFSFIIPDQDLESTGYAVSAYADKMYFGQSDGLYSLVWKNYFPFENQHSFSKIQAADGQVWSTAEVGKNLWVGHHEGLIGISDQALTRYDPGKGTWTCLALDDWHMVVGTYDGLSVYKKTNKGYVLHHKIEGLKESCRIVVKDGKSQIWVSHPYRGIYRVKFTDLSWTHAEVKHFTSAHGLPSDFNNYVFSIAGKPVFGTEKGVYRFRENTQRFIPADDFNQNLGSNVRVKYLKEDTAGNIWFVAGDKTGLLAIDDLGLKKSAQKKVFPELEGRLVGGFEFIYPYQPNQVFFASETGFIFYQPKTTAEPPIQLFFSKVEGKGDTLLAGNHHVAFHGADQKLSIPYAQNDLTFYFAVSGILYKDLVEYRCLLEGYDDEWTHWSADHSKPYTKLKPGTYTLKVQARIRGGRQQTEKSCVVVVDPPWYLSKIAFLFYFLGAAVLLLTLIRIQFRKFELEKLQIREAFQEEQAKQALQVEQARAALVEMQNEKLAAEISFKNQELASATMHLVQKGEVLLTIKQALDQILEKSPGPEVRKEIQGLINLMNFDNKIDEDWEQFSHHFDQVHVNFIERLRKKYPQITANDEKLCAYLRLNLSTKETAQMMNISVRGVEASRYRLRKKLGLSNEENLVEFMMRV
jgi:ligand-binding sensor domain-containing protein/DNA-binding CsgD family transcriptional regulator